MDSGSRREPGHVHIARDGSRREPGRRAAQSETRLGEEIA